MSNEKENEHGQTEFPWRILKQSVLGASHARSGLPNQDAILSRQNPKKGVPLILAIADGHGSEKYFRSDQGAQFAVQAAEQEMQSFLRTVTHQGSSHVEALAEQLPRNIVGRWQGLVEDHWREYPFMGKEWQWLTKRENAKARREISENYTLPYGATLLTVVVTDSYILYLQLGDGDILTISTAGKVLAPLPEDKRHLANETTSLCMPDAAHNFRMHFQKLARRRPALIMVSTDGYANSFRNKEGFFKVGSDIWHMIRNEKNGLQTVENSLEGWLREATKTGSGDDITLGLLCRMDALMEVVEEEEEKKRVTADLPDANADEGGKQPVSVGAGSQFQPAGTPNDYSHQPSFPANMSAGSGVPIQPEAQSHLLAQLEPVADKENKGFSPSLHTQNAPSQIIIVSQEPGKGDTHSISEAMRMARSHAHIRVQPGIYREQLIIDKPVTLVGEGACEQIVVEGYVPCLHIKHDLVTLSNMTVRGKCNPDHKHYPAIYIDKAQPTLKHCDVVSESDVGIGIRGLGADPEIQSCYIHRTRGDGIFFADHARGLVEKCTIVHNEGSGIVIGQETHPRLKECSIRENMHYAIVMLEKSQATVEDCTLTDNQRGPWHIGEDCHINRDRSVE